MGPGGRRRYLSAGLYAVILLLVTSAVGYRVFAPRDTLDRAQHAYPAPAVATPRLYGTILDMPVVVDGRLRVYAAKREVWADQPVDMRSAMSPYWAYRRWPATLLGVVAVGTTVVSRWSDGDLVALDATRGTIAWRTRGPALGTGYTGRRTGAASVYAPPGMYTAGAVLIVAGNARVTGYDAATGRPLWTRVAGRCDYFTGPDSLVTACHGPAGVTAYDAMSGQQRDWTGPGQGLQPFACAVGRSECRGVRTPGHAWVIGAGAALTAADALADPGTWLVGDVVVVPRPDGSLAGQALAGGRLLWSWPAVGAAPDGARVVAVQPGAVHVLTAARDLVSVDPADGLELCRIGLVGDGNAMFDPGYVYAADGFVFLERLLPGAKPGDPDPRYYYPSPNVLAVGV